ncbi:cytochrome P450 [Aurantimonas sp. C2-6-R+9]|uniref:cytochrome P450 n=1 Tax=unclassified Aurantimonas TaxID=2638230 RepID=UPI002E19E7B9|nr:MULTISPECIES: cytochrome P450 [unclassified Aurantimonas]MEC5289605.1 cytochrome P450 [Aurantimonas sp. C2-3-R2]MEC5379570.1 cytochrome P450 [Aurantimonas sp. C2-6-R+9]MEC5410686.1 cytochrome P450 [Aurantimonas sp. C2-4-R8]
MDRPVRPFRPPAPIPHAEPLGFASFLKTASRNPIEIWGTRAFKEPYIRGTWLGVPNIVVNDPKGVRHCLVENAANYVMQPLRQRILRPLLRDGLLTAEGALWRRTRKAIAPVFTPRNIAGFTETMQARSEVFAERLAGRLGETVDGSHEMTLLTFDILQATLFTDDIAGDGETFATSTQAFLGSMGRVDPLDLLGAPAFLPRLRRLRGRRSMTYFRSLIAATIEGRRAQIKRDPDGAPNDLLSLLIKADGLSADEIEDNIITFIGAGHETTARSLAWTLYLLSQAPAERAAVEAELDSVLPTLSHPSEWVDRLVYTRAVFEEALRLYPPAPSLNRTALAPDRVGDVEIPAGATVLVMPWLIHRHEMLWDRPDHFIPSRFLPGNRETIDRYQYLPFGVGPRVCIGASFALQEGVIALAALLKHLRFDYAGSSPPEVVQRITVQPLGGLPLRVARR